MDHPTLNNFLSEISSILQSRDGNKLCSYLVIEPPYAPIYETLRREIRSAYPSTATNSQSTAFSSTTQNSQSTTQARIEATCSKKLETSIKECSGDGPTWTAFVKFMAQYFIFLRDVDVSNLLATYELLSELVQKANSALTHSISGVILLPTVVSYSRMLSRLAIGLDKQPHLIAHLNSRSNTQDDGSTRETLPERAANIIRQAFVTCLNDRSGTANNNNGLTASGQPEGKKRGIYTIANLCLKILFQCRKIRGAAQIFENIYNQSPPLAAFPKSERVTYLYYLGRFSFANGHFFTAQKALQKSWEECHYKCTQQARLIVIFLITANIICGRLPKRRLLTSCAPDLIPVFEPICMAIRKGDLASFRKRLSVEGPHHAFLARFRVVLQLRNRGEVLLWRTLVRKSFLLMGDAGNPEAKKAPTLDLNVLLRLWRWQERSSRPMNVEGTAQSYLDPDFDGVEGTSLSMDEEYDLFSMTDVISRMSSLINQDFINGYLSFKFKKLAIQGARQRGAMSAGFPNIWKVIVARSGTEVPGWKLDMRTGGSYNRGQFGAGQVINLAGARPVGTV